MKITKYIAVLLAGIGIAFGSSAFAAQISVPSASAVAQMLVSLANGNYQASSSPTLSGRLTASSFTATSTTVNNVLPLLSVTRSTTTNATTTSLGISGILSSLLKTTSTGGVVAAVLGTDYINLSSLSASSPISYNNGTGAFSWTGLATTSQPSSSNLLVSNGGAGVYGVATTSANCSGNTTCTPFTVIGSSPITISSTGGGSGVGTVATSSVETANQIPYYTSNAAYPALIGSEAGFEYDPVTNAISVGTTKSSNYYDPSGVFGIVIDNAQGITITPNTGKTVAIADPSSGSLAEFITSGLSSSRVYTFPDKNGTFAMLSDITGASSTLLSDNNTWSGGNIFTRSTTTQSTTTNAFASSLFSLNGTFTTINATGTSFATQSSIPFLTITRSTTTYATTTYLNVSGGATTTFGNGISLSGGCFFVNGACITPGAGSSAVGGTGAIQYANGTSFAGDNTKFTWDSTNLRLSIGTGTPFAKFSVQGAYGSSENMIDVASSTNSSGSATSSLLLLTSDGKLVVNSHVGNGVNTIEAKNDYNDATFACRSTAGYGACWFNLYATAPQYFGIQGFDSSAGDNLVWKIGRSGDSNGVYVYTLDGNTLAAQFTDTQNFLVPTGKIGVGTSTPFAMLSVQGTLGSQNLLFNIASSTGSNSYLSIFSVKADGTISTDFLSGTTTKNRAINEPDSIAVLTAASTNSMYNDDLSRMIQCSSVANSGQVTIRNGSFSTAASNVYHVTGGGQQMGMGSLTNSVMTARGCITYGGYHYVLVASSTNATVVAIRRATSSDYVNVGIATAWATSTVSGTVFTGGLSATFPILVGAANNSIYIATSTTAIAQYTVSTSTNTLTYVSTVTISGASIAITNTRVNNNGLYVGFAAAPIVRKYDFSGNLLPGANYIAATPGNGPDLVATANSIYALSAGSTVLLSRIRGW